MDSDEKAEKYYEETLRLMNEIVGLIRENNRMNQVLNDYVRKIIINTNER